MPQIKKILVHEGKSLSNSAILTYNVPSFDTIDDIYLRLTNSGAAAAETDIKSSIGKIAVNINGEQVINTTIERIYDFYKFLGNEVNQNRPANVVSLNLGRLIFISPENEDYFAWGCSNINTIQVQVYCNNTVSKVTDCEVVTERRPVTSSLGAYIKLISYPQAMAAAGTSTVDTLPRDSNEAYLCVLAAAGTGGTISQGEVVMNGMPIYDPVTQAIDDMVVANRCFSPVTGYFNYLFADRSIKGLLPMQGVTELRFKTQFSAAPTAGVYDLLACTIKNVPTAMLNAYNSGVGSNNTAA